MTDLTGGGVPAEQSPVEATQVSESWTVLASNGVMTLSQSAGEYAVYDHQRTYGRWPLTEEGHRYAMETYGAHQTVNCPWIWRTRRRDIRIQNDSIYPQTPH